MGKQYYPCKIRNKARMSALTTSIQHCAVKHSQFNKINDSYKGINKTSDLQI